MKLYNFFSNRKTQISGILLATAGCATITYINYQSKNKNTSCQGDACSWTKLQFETGGNPYCGGRHGGQVYVKNNHPQHSINTTIDVYFKGKPSGSKQFKLEGRNYEGSREFVGCTKWQGDGVPPDEYRYEITRANFTK
jgi:hypothetical protein